MDLSDILSNIADQDRGRELELVDPVTGKPTGIKLWIVGPDSKTAHDARIAMSEELIDRTRSDGTVSAGDRERARIGCLARLVQRWEILENGQPVPFNHRNVVRVLSAGTWIQAQVDAFAADRSAFRSGSAQ
ncbi:hypothetical protein GCM10011491_05690 [Brucella endophytica]|uniref:Uncharacterized protein n=1 Tax=Brucella endophytica TaxID=1963359 RepID=A0A916S4Z1_9HYPH|nr:hypothetical protein [Brucella endophytica]GGA81270.1 hypothetical protein GCM10011491_05690 [Brucella endophytica]